MHYLRRINSDNKNLLIDHRPEIFHIMIWLFGAILFFPTILWIVESFSHSSNRLSTLIVLVIISLFIRKLYHGKTGKSEFKLPEEYYGNRTAFLTFIFSVTCYILLETFLRINIFSGVFFALSIFSLSGFYLPQKTWKKGLLPLMFFILALPFGNSLDIYLGFPMRMFSTKVSEYVLSGLGIESITRETIIIIENSAAKVDNACSGLKGIWSGLLFFFGATWIEQKKAGLRWFLSLLIFLGSLTLFNVLRIVILVITETALGMVKTAEAIHIPLGIAGFVFSCIIAWFLLRLIPGEPKEPKNTAHKPTQNRIPLKLHVLILLLLVSGIFLTHKQSKAVASISPHENSLNLRLPSFSLKPVELTRLEKRFLIKSSNDLAVKKRFNFKNLSGTILISINNNFRRHHSPEECMIGSGLKIDKSVTHLIRKDFPVQFASLQEHKLSASYWFQSRLFTTEDFSSRVWAQILGREKEWALVSVMFDSQIDLADKDVKDFHILIYQEIKRILKLKEK